MPATTIYERQHWSTWYRKDLLSLAYWPKYVAEQTDWVNTSIPDLVRDLVEGGIRC